MANNFSSCWLTITQLWVYFVGFPNAQKAYIVFYKTNIDNGTITNVYAGNGATRFRIAGMDVELGRH
ncbi:hypothetical protein [Pinibacter soli]|uniref:Uncharacterized protein n=1 Tax=Pinibacter soli TaxID=3044211 RepID=A0ABT6RC06_9BACT|nr:hypothetical protein [Pinibacter soli]MDI3319427.1 hypothetical protein [Pinibacter soli]